MRNDKDNLIVNRSLEFALDIIAYSEHLEEKKKFVVARQLLRSGTSKIYMIIFSLMHLQLCFLIYDLIYLRLQIFQRQAILLPYRH